MIDYPAAQKERVSKQATRTLSYDDRWHTERFLESGYPVGGDHEKIIHVTQLTPKNPYEGYVGQFFYLLFLPLTFLAYRHRLQRDADAYFFPPNYPYAGRIVLTDHRLFLCHDVNRYYVHSHSFPFDSIREVRQSGASIVVQPIDQSVAAVTVRVGPEIGELLRVIHLQSAIRVRDPDRDWQPRD